MAAVSLVALRAFGRDVKRRVPQMGQTLSYLFDMAAQSLFIAFLSGSMQTGDGNRSQLGNIFKHNKSPTPRQGRFRGRRALTGS